ncbi:HdeD family acid-resistance protein [Candidatus Protochlamydia sp. R18]|uniref:HdeD family acid-resistance protein n=1 Tax=Candidatus Protochlamydia sp. R18 TaxID=1353977 RepID=UPI0005A66CEF|nr:HdeD family acid-resistance protein [Candidatus Protochlamydia sp. R18]
MLEFIQKNRTLLIIEGFLFALLGIIAIALPGISTLSTELFIGWFILLGGVIQTYRAFQSYREKGFWASFVVSLMYLLFGILLLIDPSAGVISLTILLMLFFIFEGVAKIIMGFQLKSTNSWIWFIFSGVLSLMMAGIIWMGWPETAFWVLGLLVGINLLFFGLSLTFLALGITKIDQEQLK